MSTLNGNELVQFAKSKLGTPYVYGAKIQDGPLTQHKVDFLAKNYPSVVNQSYLQKIKDRKLIGQVCVDCSGLIAGYTNKIIGSAQMYSTAKSRMAFKNYKEFAPGVVLWRSGHVGVFEGADEKGEYHVLEARGIDYGTVRSIVTASSKWNYGLTFSYMDYTYENRIGNASPRKINPYMEPISNIKKGNKGEGARWVQMELVEAGYGREFEYNGKTYSGVIVDGDIGTISDAAIRSFQQSAKLTVDGIVGKKTRAALHLDDRILIAR